MSDSLQSFDGGVSPFLTDARTIKDSLDLLRDYRDSRPGRHSAAGVGDPTAPATLIWIKNDTAGDLPALSILKLGAPTIDIASTDLRHELRARPIVSGTAPTAAGNPFCVTIEGVKAGGVGRAAILGATVCDVNVAVEAHTHAGPLAGDTAKLLSGTSGPARILHKESGTGTKKALVVLLGSSGNGLTVLEVDGSPAVASVGELRFDQADGFVVSSPGTGIVRIDINEASVFQFGVVSTSSQAFAGVKGFVHGVYVDDTAIFPANVNVLTEPTVLAGAPGPQVIVPPTGQFETHIQVGGADTDLAGIITGRRGPNPDTNGGDIWIHPFGSGLNPPPRYTGRLVVAGRYAMWVPGDRFIYTGADGVLASGAQFKGGLYLGGGTGLGGGGSINGGSF